MRFDSFCACGGRALVYVVTCIYSAASAEEELTPFPRVVVCAPYPTDSVVTTLLLRRCGLKVHQCRLPPASSVFYGGCFIGSRSGQCLCSLAQPRLGFLVSKVSYERSLHRLLCSGSQPSSQMALKFLFFFFFSGTISQLLFSNVLSRSVWVSGCYAAVC